MDNYCYIYQELIKKAYIPTTKGTTINLKPLDDKFKVRGKNYFPFVTALIPAKIISLLQELLNEYGCLSDSIDDFTSLLVYCQHHFVTSTKKEPTEISNNFIHVAKDLEALMNVLKDYLFATDRKYINSISFKFIGSKKTIAIDNFFIVDDIYRAIMFDFDLTKENFEERKQEIISLSEVENIRRITKPAEWFKKGIIKIIFWHLMDKGFSQTLSLKFIGVFLTLCQIKSNNRDKFFTSDSLKDLKADIDVKNLLHYVKR
jgi:hypothetical protein